MNGGTNGPENQNLEIGQSATISSVVPTRTGYVFAGWNTIANGSGTSYNAGATYSQDKDLLLYAVWTPNTYTISYNSGGGSGTTSATSCSYGKSCTLRNNAFTKTGYTFIGWTDTENGTNVVYKNGDTILLYNKTSNMTLYALWEITTYTVSYDANYGTGEPSDQTKTYGETLTLSSVKPTREKYAFVEWNTNADGTGTSYQPGDSYSTEQVLTLYAQWELGGYTISYNANGGSGAPDDQTKTHDVTLTLSSTVPTLTGHTFQSWNTKVDGSGTIYSAGGSYTANESATLYAQWEPDTYQVCFNANGGSGAPGCQTKAYGVTLTLSSTKPTRNGYNFLGWSTSSGATSATYASGASYTTNAGATLYAVWDVVQQYTIKYNANGGSGSMSNTVCQYNGSCTISSNGFTKNGYTFLGWTTNSNGTDDGYNWTGFSGTWVYENGQYGISSNTLTLYARWTAASSQKIYLLGETFYTGGSSNGGMAWVGNDKTCTTNYNYVVRYYFTTPASGVRTISSSFTTQGATSGTITSSNFYWYVTTSSDSHTNARTNGYTKTGVLSYASKVFTGANTSVSLAGNTTYYVYVWNACNVGVAWAKWYYNGGSSNAHVIVNG